MRTNTTTHLTVSTIPHQPASQVQPAILITLLVLVLILAGGFATYSQLPSSTAAIPTPALSIIIIATAQAQPQPTAAAVVQVAAPAAAQRWVTAFAAPDGAVLGPIPEPVMSAITGRYGNSWVSTMHDRATVWVRVSELGASLADVAPQIAPASQVIYQVADQPAQPAQEAQPAPVTTAPADYAAKPVSVPVAPQVAPAIQPAATLAPMQETDTTKEWARQQWLSEHPEAQR